jgi:hypothetical protein
MYLLAIHFICRIFSLLFLSGRPLPRTLRDGSELCERSLIPEVCYVVQLIAISSYNLALPQQVLFTQGEEECS